MKKLVAIFIGALMLQSAQAVVQTLPFGDPFNYPEGKLIDGSAGVWVAGNDGAEISVSNSAALTSPSGFAASSGKGVKVSTSGTQRRAVVQFTSVGNTDGNVVYVSFLLDGSGISSSKMIGYIDNTTSSVGSPKVAILAGGGTIGIGKSSSSAGFSTSLSAGTHLIVVRYSFQSGSDAVDLWVDPSSAYYGVATAPASLGSVTSGSDATALSALQISSPSGAGTLYYIDEVRIGTSWADVTPAGGSPPPPPPSTTNVVVTGFSILPSGDVFLQGTGGPTNGSYEVETTTDVTVPLTNWLPAGIFQFDSYGNFGCTSPVTPGTPIRFFTIHVGGTNSIPPTPPVILTQPQDTTNSAGTIATFTVGVSGSPPFSYQWYLNSVTQLAGGTNSTLTLHNVQTTDSGGYSVIVGNVAGSITSMVAQLLVTNVFSAPMIITQPQDQTVTVSNNASFSVVATGTQPLFYQWYYNTNSLLTDATNSTLALNNVQFTDAGVYQVTVSNGQGSTNSNFATLAVVPPVTNADFSQVGYSTVGGLTTGGTGGITNTFTTGQGTDFENFVWHTHPSGPAVALVSGSITLRSDSDVHIMANTSIIGIGTNAAIIGNLMCSGSDGATNIIIRNLDIQNPSTDSGQDGDAITIKNLGVHHVWIDHCTLHDTTDGIVDVTRQGDFVTISWCKIFYTAPNGHEDVDLIGGDDSNTTDLGYLHVTFHHNWWGTLCIERLPSVRFGRVHVFNNYYNVSGNHYCARTRIDAEVLVEGNWFQNVQNPWELLTTSGTTGKLLAQNNNVGYLDTSFGVTWVNGWYPGQSLIPGTDTLTPGGNGLNPPPYSYPLNNAADVPAIVTQNAGAGAGPFAP